MLRADHMNGIDEDDPDFIITSSTDNQNCDNMRRKKLIPSIQQSIKTRVHKVGTLRGLPRLFLLRRAFCFYWCVIISLFIYLKWYYPLYLTSNVNRNTLEDFGRDWCRMRNERVDWGRLREPCTGNTVYENNLPGWNVENRTNGRMSFVSSTHIQPAGQFSRIIIQSQTVEDLPKSVGGDYWRVFISGPTGFAPTVTDLGNGEYEILFLILHPGNYCLSAVLDHSLCDGMKDPPDYWFVSGRQVTKRGLNEPVLFFGISQADGQSHCIIFSYCYLKLKSYLMLQCDSINQGTKPSQSPFSRKNRGETKYNFKVLD